MSRTSLFLVVSLAAIVLSHERVRAMEPTEPEAPPLVETFQGHVEMQKPTDPADSSPGAWYREPDATDPEMAELLRIYLSQGRCPYDQRPCRNKRLPLAIYGDRMARYLIGNYQAAMREGYPVNGTLLAMIAATESPTGITFLQGLVTNGAPEERVYGVRAAGRCRDQRGIDAVLSVVRASQTSDPYLTLLGLHAIKNLLVELGSDRTDAMTLLDDVGKRREDRAMLGADGGLDQQVSGAVSNQAIAKKFAAELRERTTEEMKSVMPAWKAEVTAYRRAYETDIEDAAPE